MKVIGYEGRRHESAVCSWGPAAILRDDGCIFNAVLTQGSATFIGDPEDMETFLASKVQRLEVPISLEIEENHLSLISLLEISISNFL